MCKRFACKSEPSEIIVTMDCFYEVIDKVYEVTWSFFIVCLKHELKF